MKQFHTLRSQWSEDLKVLTNEIFIMYLTMRESIQPHSEPHLWKHILYNVFMCLNFTVTIEKAAQYSYWAAIHFTSLLFFKKKLPIPWQIPSSFSHHSGWEQTRVISENCSDTNMIVPCDIYILTSYVWLNRFWWGFWCFNTCTTYGYRSNQETK